MAVTKKTDFMCRCNPEACQTSKEVYEWALEYLECVEKDLVSNVVYALVAHHDVNSIEIGCDQWAAVCAEKYNGSLHVFVQCDRVEDGFARVLQIFVEADASGGVSNGTKA